MHVAVWSVLMMQLPYMCTDLDCSHDGNGHAHCNVVGFGRGHAHGISCLWLYCFMFDSGDDYGKVDGVGLPIGAYITHVE